MFFHSFLSILQLFKIRSRERRKEGSFSFLFMKEKVLCFRLLCSPFQSRQICLLFFHFSFSSCRIFPLVCFALSGLLCSLLAPFGQGEKERGILRSRTASSLPLRGWETEPSLQRRGAGGAVPFKVLSPSALPLPTPFRGREEGSSQNPFRAGSKQREVGGAQMHPLCSSDRSFSSE